MQPCTAFGISEGGSGLYDTGNAETDRAARLVAGAL